MGSIELTSKFMNYLSKKSDRIRRLLKQETNRERTREINETKNSREQDERDHGSTMCGPIRPEERNLHNDRRL